MSNEVILVDDEEHLRTACVQALQIAGLKVESFSSAEGALARVNRGWPGVVVTDIKMAGQNGLELMSHALERDPQLPVILITGHGDVSMAVKAMRDGAYDFIEKPFASEILVDAVRRALEKRRLILENRTLRLALEKSTGIERILVGRNPLIEGLRKEIMSYAATDADVLILGETGTGKELVARSLHELSTRSAQRFVAINCGALPDTIIESELFGHVPGAFTGATKQRIGKFEFANGGTVFLDEIESMPIDIQIKLLRVLQDRVIVRVGANDEIPVDVRIIAATKDDLKQISDEGLFRKDLYYRLDVLSLSIPPLRDRRDDIPLLFHHFLTQSAERYKRDVIEAGPETMAKLLAHDWPGNVRELQNTAVRHVLGLDIEIEQNGALPSKGPMAKRSLADQVAIVEKQIIQQTLVQNAHGLKETYEALGISRKTLYDKMQKYGLTSNSGRDN